MNLQYTVNRIRFELDRHFGEKKERNFFDKENCRTFLVSNISVIKVKTSDVYILLKDDQVGNFETLLGVTTYYPLTEQWEVARGLKKICRK